ERVVHYLKEKYPKNYTENIGAHHGSLSKQHRLNLEKRMREGNLKCIVCSTSLELGIDIGYIDLVIMLGSPKSIARATQRAGRAGHKLHDTIKGRIIVLDRDDLIESSVMLKNVLERNIDKIHIPENCLDVLAQQIYGIAISDQIHIDDLFKLIKRSYSYRNLDKNDFLEVIKYLSGFYNTLEDRHVYAKIWYDESNGMIGKKGKLARVIYMTNIGTIPDETFITVKVGEQIIGYLDENFLEKMKHGDVFNLGGQTYEFNFSRGMVAQVKSSPGRPPTIPNWVSEMLPLSFDLAMEIGKFRRLMEEKFKNKTKKEILEFIDSYLYVDKNASLAIYNYFNEQYLYLKEIPNDKKILIEHYNEDNKKYVIFHSLFGRRVNDCLSRAIGYTIGKLQHKDVEVGINDNGFYLSYEGHIQVVQSFKLLKSEKIRILLELAINNSEILKRRFRHCATRSLMILREYKGHKKRVGRQQVSSMLLISALRRISNDFCILKEARREVLEDLMDIENTTKILKLIEKDEIKLKEVHTSIPSPFAFNIALQGYLDVLKMEDKIKFLRNMHTLILAKIGKENEIEYENS
ncbi:MAG: helicase-related protein, partial [Nanoarchaeota archaeon]